MHSPKNDHPNKIRNDINIIKNKQLLSSNKFADCSFLVGHEGKAQKLFYAIKSEMLISSMVMRNRKELLDASMTTPVRIFDITPNTFQLVLEFAHLNNILTTLKDIDEVIDLANSAKTLDIKFLPEKCAMLLEPFVNVSNVWTILDILISQGHEITAQACASTLTLSTTASFKNPSALKVSEESIMFVLKLPKLNIETENEIVNLCINWVSKYPISSFRDAALRRFLPHLRLLTLTLEEAALLPANLINGDEKLALIETIVSRAGRADALKKSILPKTLNNSEASRVSSCGLKIVLIPESILLQPLEEVRLYQRYVSNSVWLVPKMDLHLIEIEILAPEVLGHVSSFCCREEPMFNLFNVTLKLIAKDTKSFITFNIRDIPRKSGQKLCVLQHKKITEWILKKDEQVHIKVDYSASNRGGCQNLFKKVQSDEVCRQLKISNPLLLHNGFHKIWFASCTNEVSFIKSISYAISSSESATKGILNPPSMELSNTSTEDEDEEDEYSY